MIDIELYGKLCNILKLEGSEQEKLHEIMSNYVYVCMDNRTSWDESVKKYLETKECAGLAKSTIKAYENRLMYFGTYTNNKAPSLITKEDVSGFLAFRKEDIGCKDTTLKGEFNYLHIFFEWCCKEKIIFKNPCVGIKIKCNSRTRHALTDEQIDKLRNSCETIREKATFEFFLTTGCRKGEVEKIKPEDFDFNDNSITVFGKGSKYRTVYFDAKTAELVKQLIEENKGGKVFITPSVTLKGLQAKSGVHVFPHLMRHTFATKALENGLDLLTIQKLLGHNDLVTTQIYAETSMNQVKKDYVRVFDS